MARLPLDGKHRENALLGSSLLYAGMRSFDFAGTSLREVSAALKMTEMGAAYARLGVGHGCSSGSSGKRSFGRLRRDFTRGVPAGVRMTNWD